MSFEKRYTEIMVKTPEPRRRNLWLNTIFFSVIIFLVLFVIITIQRDAEFLRRINAASAWTSVILIGMSMLLSALCFFWDFIDSKIIYRKHLGLVGLGYALIHTSISLFAMSDRFPFPEYYLREDNILPFTFAVLALIYFIFMALISNKFAIKELGPQKWRNFLRFGYIAYIFTILHFGIKGWPWWSKWVQGGMQTLPPIGLVLFVFALFVPYFRIILQLALRKKPEPTL